MVSLLGSMRSTQLSAGAVMKSVVHGCRAAAPFLHPSGIQSMVHQCTSHSVSAPWSLASGNEEAHEFLRGSVNAFCCGRHLCRFRGFCSRGAGPSLLAWCLIRHPRSWRICRGRGLWSICGPSLHKHGCHVEPDIVLPYSLRRCSLAAVVKPTASLLNARLPVTVG